MNIGHESLFVKDHIRINAGSIGVGCGPDLFWISAQAVVSQPVGTWRDLLSRSEKEKRKKEKKRKEKKRKEREKWYDVSLAESDKISFVTPMLLRWLSPLTRLVKLLQRPLRTPSCS